MIRSGWTQLPHEAVCSGLQSVLHTVDRTEDDTQNTKGKENNKTGISHTLWIWTVWQTLAERHMTPTCRHMTPTCRHMTPTYRHLTPTLSKKNWIFIEILIGKIHQYCVDLRPFVRFPKYLFYPKLFQYYISLLKGGCQVTAGGC